MCLNLAYKKIRSSCIQPVEKSSMLRHIWFCHIWLDSNKTTWKKRNKWWEGANEIVARVSLSIKKKKKNEIPKSTHTHKHQIRVAIHGRTLSFSDTGDPLNPSRFGLRVLETSPIITRHVSILPDIWQPRCGPHTHHHYLITSLKTAASLTCQLLHFTHIYLFIFYFLLSLN